VLARGEVLAERLPTRRSTNIASVVEAYMGTGGEPGMADVQLAVRDVHGWYMAKATSLHGRDIASSGEVVTMLRPNGAAKRPPCGALMGMLAQPQGLERLRRPRDHSYKVETACSATASATSPRGGGIFSAQCVRDN